MSYVALTTIIKTRHSENPALGVPPVPLACMERWLCGPDIYDQPPPSGWEWADGSVRKRKDYDPILADRCRDYTHWFRWHVLRQFNLPSMAVTIGVDPR